MSFPSLSRYTLWNNGQMVNDQINLPGRSTCCWSIKTKCQWKKWETSSCSTPLALHMPLAHTAPSLFHNQGKTPLHLTSCCCHTNKSLLFPGRWNPLPYSYNVRRKIYYPMKGVVLFPVLNFSDHFLSGYLIFSTNVMLNFSLSFCWLWYHTKTLGTEETTIKKRSQFISRTYCQVSILWLTFCISWNDVKEALRLRGRIELWLCFQFLLKLRLNAALHSAFFLATNNAILLLRDVNEQRVFEMYVWVLCKKTCARCNIHKRFVVAKFNEIMQGRNMIYLTLVKSSIPEYGIFDLGKVQYTRMWCIRPW